MGVHTSCLIPDPDPPPPASWQGHRTLFSHPLPSFSFILVTSSKLPSFRVLTIDLVILYTYKALRDFLFFYLCNITYLIHHSFNIRIWIKHLQAAGCCARSLVPSEPPQVCRASRTKLNIPTEQNLNKSWNSEHLSVLLKATQLEFANFIRNPDAWLSSQHVSYPCPKKWTIMT